MVVKGRTLLLSVFISLSIALGRVKQADAQSTGVMKSTHQSNLKSSVSSQPRVSQKVANDMTPRLKKTVEVELNIAAPKLSDRKSFHTKNVVVASASSHHGTDSSAAKVSPVQRTVREDITQDKVKKNRKSGSVVLKEEAEKEVKQSLYGLADSMKGAHVYTLNVSSMIMGKCSPKHSIPVCLTYPAISVITKSLFYVFDE